MVCAASVLSLIFCRNFFTEKDCERDMDWIYYQYKPVFARESGERMSLAC